MAITKKNLIFLGAPGSGKGTMASALREVHPLAHISTGDLLRDEIKRGTELGKAASGIMQAGGLVPDDVVCGMVRNRLAQPDCAGGFILDGFPRTVAQAEALDHLLTEKGLKLDAVIELVVDQEKLVNRILNRAAEAAAKGEPVRKDDDPVVFKTRLEAYNRDTAVVAPYYKARGQLKQIDGMAPIDQVTAAIDGVLAEAA